MLETPEYINPHQSLIDKARNAEDLKTRSHAIIDISTRSIASGTIPLGKRELMSKGALGGLYALGNLACDQSLEPISLREIALHCLSELAASSSRGCAGSALEDYLKPIAQEPEAGPLQTRLVKSLRAILEAHHFSMGSIIEIMEIVKRRTDLSEDTMKELERLGGLVESINRQRPLKTVAAGHSFSP